MSVTITPMRSRAHLVAGVALVVFWLTVYLFTVSPTVNFIDSGELITAAYEPGIAHPPGYPLYVLMGYVSTHLLWGEVAWRLNILSSFWASMCVGALYFLILSLWSYIQSSRVARETTPPKRIRGSRAIARPEPGTPPPNIRYTTWEILAASGAASLLGASASFWSRSAQAKMYSLHFFFIVLLYWFALGYRSAYERRGNSAARRWLVGLIVAGSFSFTNHLMTSLLVPGLALVVLFGEGWNKRLRAVLREWRVIIPSLLPLLLYLYLPLRMAQDPYMNWGSPDSWGDFRRHISGWQYQAYWWQDVEKSIRLIQNYAAQQWGLLTLPILATSIAGGVYFYRLHSRLFIATASTAAITLLFSIGYSISEIEPYLIPIYMMLTLWLGVGAVALASGVRTMFAQDKKLTGNDARPPAYLAPLILAVTALVALVLQYPQQDRSRDHMAPAFVRNTFSELPNNSIVITDYWDFYAPTYYLQHVMGERPDITVIDMSLLTYPWYTDQLRVYDPQLLAKSEDIVSSFGALQRRWVDGESLDPNELSMLNARYIGLLTSFVERNPDRRAYVLFNAPCNEPQAPQGCPGNQVAPSYARYPSGLAFELVKPENRPNPPAFPEYDLRGITSEQIHMDLLTCMVARYYETTYQRLSRLYQLVTMPEQASLSSEKVNEISAVLQSSETCRRLEVAQR